MGQRKFGPFSDQLQRHFIHSFIEQLIILPCTLLHQLENSQRLPMCRSDDVLKPLLPQKDLYDDG